MVLENIGEKMHIQINITGRQWLTIAVIIFLVSTMYRLIKKFTRRCECGRWLLVERVKIMEEDPDAFDDDIVGKMYFAYILGVCVCGLVHQYKIIHKRFTASELWWRHVFHPSEFTRPDSYILLEKAGIVPRAHPPNKAVAHKNKANFHPDLSILPQLNAQTGGVKSAQVLAKKSSTHEIKPKSPFKPIPSPITSLKIESVG